MPVIRPRSTPSVRLEGLPDASAWGRFARAGRADLAWLVPHAAGPWSAEPLVGLLAAGGPRRALSLPARAASWRLSADHWTSALLAPLSVGSLADALGPGLEPLVVVLHHEGGPLEDLPEPTLMSLAEWISGPLCAALPPGGAGLRLVLPLGRGRVDDGHDLAQRVLTEALNEAEHHALGHLPAPVAGSARAAGAGGGYRGAPRAQ